MNFRTGRCFLLLTAWFLSLGTFISAQQTLSRSMKVAGVTRTYIVHVPLGLNKPPLVLNIHGQGWTGSGFEYASQMDKVADREKFIVVYPDALNKSWDYSGAHEFAFLLAIIDTIDAHYDIDRNRVYSMGFSQGGVMSFHLACRYASVFAAIAPASQYIWDTACKPARPVPMRLVFGTNDFLGSSSSRIFMAAVAKWLKFDSCPAAPAVTRPYPANHPLSKVTRLFYGPCAQGTEVVADSISGGTHEWPMDTVTAINNSEESWAFVKKFSLRGGTAAVAVEAPPAVRREIPASCRSGSVFLPGIGEQCPVRVIDTRGRQVAGAVAVRQRFSFKNRPAGVYVVVADVQGRPVATRMAIP